MLIKAEGRIPTHTRENTKSWYRRLVSRLVAIEELAGVDALCADKAGTLTQNSLTLGTPFAVDGVTAATVILDGARHPAPTTTTPSTRLCSAV